MTERPGPSARRECSAPIAGTPARSPPRPPDRGSLFSLPCRHRISGIADYAARLLKELKATYTIDLYHDAGYVPDLGLTGHDFAAYDGRLFDRIHAVLNYHAIVYQMGNSVAYHGYCTIGCSAIRGW